MSREVEGNVPSNDPVGKVGMTTSSIRLDMVCIVNDFACVS